MQEQVEVLNGDMLDKQEVYKNEAQNRLIKAGTIEEIKLSKKMTPDTVDVLEDTLTKLKDKFCPFLRTYSLTTKRYIN